MKHRIALFVVLTALLGAANVYYNTAHQPGRSTDAALAAVNGGADAARAVRVESTINNEVNLGFAAAQLLVTLACFGGPVVGGMARLANARHGA